jgi:hypothetical protein
MGMEGEAERGGTGGRRWRRVRREEEERKWRWRR